MNIVEESIVIDKPRQEVADFLADPDNVTLYSSNISDYRIVSGEPTEIGRRAQFTVKVAGVQLEFEDELVAYEDGMSMTLRSDHPKLPYTIFMTLADEGAGTRVNWRQEAESGSGLFKLADKLVTKMYSRDVRANLENAKALIEG